MRWIVLALLAVPLAGAHFDHEPLEPGDYLPHVWPVTATLAPNETRNWTLAFEGAPMPGDWHWLIRADVEGTVRMDLDIEGTSIATWNWGTGSQAELMQLGHTGLPGLNIMNIGTQEATVRFYYDHTCDCTAKAPPLSPGLVWLNTDAAEGDEVRMEMFIQPVQPVIDASPMPEEITVRARYVVADALGGFVPGAEVEKTFRTSDPFCDTAPSRWNGCMELVFEAQHDGRQLVLVETMDDAPAWNVLIVPNIEVAEDAAAPGAGVLPVLAVAVVAVTLRRR